MYLCTTMFGLSLFSGQFEEDSINLYTVSYVSQQVALSLCSSLCSRRVLRHQKWLVIVIAAMFAMTKNPTMKTFDESDHVHESQDDHWSTSGSEDCLVMFPFSTFPSKCSSVKRCHCLFLGGFYDIVLVFGASPFSRRSDVIHVSFALHRTAPSGS